MAFQSVGAKNFRCFQLTQRYRVPEFNKSEMAKIMDPILDNLQRTIGQISQTTRQCGRDPHSVNLTVASKTQPLTRLKPILRSGHRVFGENRVQEAQEKWPELRNHYGDVELHMIGHLQSNKSDDAVRLFDVIETLDRVNLAKALARSMNKLGRVPRLFVEVNTGFEPQKSGVLPNEADNFIRKCRSEYEFEITGLMCVPPTNKPAAAHFAMLAKIAERNGLIDLSMGMSSDFTIAIELGATYVRLGTAIFGERSERRGGTFRSHPVKR